MKTIFLIQWTAAAKLMEERLQNMFWLVVTEFLTRNKETAVLKCNYYCAVMSNRRSDWMKLKEMSAVHDLNTGKHEKITKVLRHSSASRK